MKLLIALSLMIFVSGGSCYSYAKQHGSISAEAFGTLPEILSVQISPDGTKLLMLKSINDEIVIVTKFIEDETSEENIIRYDDGVFNWVIWTSDDHLLASIKFLGHEDRAMNLRVSSQRRLLSMTWDGKDIINPNRFRKWGQTNLAFSNRQPIIQDHVVDVLKDDPDNILVQMDIKKINVPAVYKLNLKTKKKGA